MLRVCREHRAKLRHRLLEPTGEREPRASRHASRLGTGRAFESRARVRPEPAGLEATLDLVLNAPENALTTSVLDEVFKRIKSRAAEIDLDDIDVNISVIPNRVFRYQADLL